MLTLEQWDIDRPKDYPNNARKWSARAIETVGKSIKTYGWRQPVVVDSDGVIIVGHPRRAGGKWAGEKQCPVHVASDLTPAQVKAYRLADNRTSEESSWNVDLLAMEFGELKAMDFDLSLTGFASIEIEPFGYEITRPPASVEENIEEMRRWLADFPFSGVQGLGNP